MSDQWQRIYEDAYEREWDRMLAEIAEYRDETDNGDPGTVAALNQAVAFTSWRWHVLDAADVLCGWFGHRFCHWTTHVYSWAARKESWGA